jgi:hypothetical protein
MGENLSTASIQLYCGGSTQGHTFVSNDGSGGRMLIRSKHSWDDYLTEFKLSHNDGSLK